MVVYIQSSGQIAQKDYYEYSDRERVIPSQNAGSKAVLVCPGSIYRIRIKEACIM